MLVVRFIPYFLKHSCFQKRSDKTILSVLNRLIISFCLSKFICLQFLQLKQLFRENHDEWRTDAPCGLNLVLEVIFITVIHLARQTAINTSQNTLLFMPR